MAEQNKSGFGNPSPLSSVAVVTIIHLTNEICSEILPLLSQTILLSYTACEKVHTLANKYFENHLTCTNSMIINSGVKSVPFAVCTEKILSMKQLPYSLQL